jgi:glyoxylase-like metal-dependent hydrolase (beta-lactamase superfamily II)
MKRLAILAVALAVAGTMTLSAQARRDKVKTPRLYVFDDGAIKGLGPQLFNFTREELPNTDVVMVSYLIVHPKGTLMWDSGGIPDSAFTADGTEVKSDVMTASHELLPQLATVGYAPTDITYFALSHYHSDHTANANAFAGSTWIVQKAERDAMFAETPPSITAVATYSALKNAKTQILNGEDDDVFGDGTVVIKSAPGHTPGHQVLFVKLRKTGPVILAGDLYHYPIERTTGRVPTFEFNADESRASRRKIEAFAKQTGAKLWIEHDAATFASLPKAPKYID